MELYKKKSNKENNSVVRSKVEISRKTSKVEQSHNNNTQEKLKPNTTPIKSKTEEFE